MQVRNAISDLVAAIEDLETLKEKVEALNYARAELHRISPLTEGE